MEFGHKVIHINPARCQNMIFGHCGCIWAKVSSLLVKGSKFGVQKGDFGPKKGALLFHNHGKGDPKVMFFCHTLVWTL